ncbi:hypothetical protein J4221_01470 [Candidatus Pacearchaeota archaeon]|nr:hypothetical protein [Candidatus Pacearchaeota archaeon]
MKIINKRDDKMELELKKSKRGYHITYSRISSYYLLIIFLLLFLAIPSVHAIGVTPGRTSLDYKPGEEHEIIFSVLNNEKKDMQVVLMVGGELNASVSLFSDSLISFNSNEESKQLRYKIKMPEEIVNEPGLHKAEIIALEIPNINEKGTIVGATTAVVHQLFVYVPCPGKCIETGLEVLDAESNNTAVFIVPVINRGKLGIGEARALIDIYDSSNDKISSLETDYLPVPVGSRTELSARWNVTVSPGDYLAKVSVFYDGETLNFEKIFEIGEETLSIESIFANNFRLGEIAQLEILVQNRKNKELENVFANLMIFNKESQVMADLKSAQEDINALSRKTLTIYWDTVGVEEGEYNGKLMIVYGKTSKDRNLILKVSKDSLDIFGVGYAIQPKGRGGTNITSILVIIIILLIIVNVSWMIYFKLKGRKA